MFAYVFADAGKPLTRAPQCHAAKHTQSHIRKKTEQNEPNYRRTCGVREKSATWRQ